MSNDSFKELKNKDTSQLVRDILARGTKKPTHARTDDFLIQALRFLRQKDDATSLKECGRGNYCGYTYCSGCRKRQSLALLKKFKTHIYKEGYGENKTREQLRWITILHDLVPLNVDDVKQSVSTARKDFKSIKRMYSDTWGQGAFEFELISMKLLNEYIPDDGSESRKRQVLRSMCYGNTVLDSIDDSINERVLVHTHFLMDCKNHSWLSIEKSLKMKWSKPYQVRIDRLHDSGKTDLETSLVKMSSYPFKNRSQFK